LATRTEGRLQQDDVVLSIREYFADRVILLTGVTGFLGTVLIEKLLRDLSDTQRIYVLLRTADGTTDSARDRFQRDVLASPAFSRLRSTHGAAFDAFVADRVTAIHGDVGQPDLALDPDIRAELQRELDAIINVAGDVRFDAPLDAALLTNTLGPMHLLQLARECVKPVVFGHVSTCYVSGGISGTIPEEPIDPTRAPRDGVRYDVNVELAQLLSFIGRVDAASRTRLRIGADEAFRSAWVRRRMVRMGMQRARRLGWNDVYTLTKAMGEQLLTRSRGAVPVVIVRPAIIESALAQPMPGWIDRLRMADPLAVAYGRYHLPEFPGSGEGALDIVPVDTVVNAVLAAVAAHQPDPDVTVYQVAASDANPMSVREFVWYLRESFERETVLGRKRTRELPVLTYPPLDSFLRTVRYRDLAGARVQQLTGRLLRATAWGSALEQRARARRLALQRRRNQAELLGPYTMLRCRYVSDNLQRLWSMIGSEERSDFNFDITAIDWRDYVRHVHVPGVQKYVLGMAREPAPPAMTVVMSERSGRGVTPALSGPTARVMQRTTRSAFGLILRHYLHMTWEGLENADGAAPFIAVSNHSSHADAAALMVLLNRPGRIVRPVAARDYFFSTPIRGWLSRTFLDAVPIERQLLSASTVSLAVSLLRRGHSLIYFPEGGRSSDGTIGEFKRGAAVTALAAGVPVLPIHISGSFDALPKGRWFPRRHALHVRIGRPISTQPYLGRDTTASLQDRARRLTDDVHHAVRQLGAHGA
jgi:1-acyl-sn-glycerol-3-phosphate acyltransferase